MILSGLTRYHRTGLPKVVWQLQAGSLINSIGTGAAYPFLLLYLHRVRDFSLSVSGGIVSLIAVGTIAATLVTGPLIDRWGPRRSLATVLVVYAAGFGGMIAVRAPWQAVLLALVIGLGNAGFWASNALLVAQLAGPENRNVAFAVERTVANLGIGVGAVGGGVMAATIGYNALFIVNAASFLLYLVIILARWRKLEVPRTETARDGASLRLLADPALRRMLALKTLLIMVGFGPFEVLAAFQRDRLGIGEGLIGLVIFVNPLVIVLLQVPLANLLRGRRRMPLLAAVALSWALAWSIVELAGLTATGAAAAFLLFPACALVGLGEAVQAPVQEPIILGLAPEGAQGRVMALSGMSFQIGLVGGPAIGGLALQHAPLALWVAAAGLSLVAGAAALGFERFLPADLRHV